MARGAEIERKAEAFPAVRPAHAQQIARPSGSRTPVPRSAMEMGHRHDEDPIGLRPIDQRVGEPSDQCSTKTVTERVAAVGEIEQPLVRALYCGDEVEAQVLRVLLVVLRRGDELCFGLPVELDLPHRRVERAFSMT